MWGKCLSFLWQQQQHQPRRPVRNVLMIVWLAQLHAHENTKHKNMGLKIQTKIQSYVEMYQMLNDQAQISSRKVETCIIEVFPDAPSDIGTKERQESHCLGWTNLQSLTAWRKQVHYFFLAAVPPALYSCSYNSISISISASIEPLTNSWLWIQLRKIQTILSNNYHTDLLFKAFPCPVCNSCDVFSCMLLLLFSYWYMALLLALCVLQQMPCCFPSPPIKRYPFTLQGHRF